MKRYINQWTNKEVESHLKKTTDLQNSVVSFNSAGEGNMNYTMRIVMENGESLIMKQSPPFCAKFPTIPAPEQRIHSERHYYTLTNNQPSLEALSPSLLGFDPKDLILYMTDLGEGTDFESVYNREPMNEKDLKTLVHYLKVLHKIKINKGSEFKNTQMRELNSQYIFQLPFDELNKSIDLDEVTVGLEKICLSYKGDQELKKKIKELEKYYWQDAQTLIHGDFYPRSWLKAQDNIFVIDPEFSFYGIPEFDLSVFIAHMEMSGQGRSIFDLLVNFYGEFNQALALKLAAVEIFRRVMFVTQLPIANDIDFKKSLLERSYQVIMGDDPMALFRAH